MDAKVLTKLLGQYGDAKKDGDKLVMSSDVDITLFAVLGASQMAMEGVQEVTFEGEMVSVRTSKDRFVCWTSDLRAFRMKERKSVTGYGTR